jgi:L-alanine-DL-glutamate epimerase-like enolase superfamily enzyme
VSDPITIRSVTPIVLRAPSPVPVVNSFGTKTDRVSVLVRIDSEDGVTGWGEVWCNYPTVGAEHRGRLIETMFAPMIAGRTFESPEAVFHALTDKTRIMALQTLEIGPIAQCIAGIDIAIWDLAARRAGEPLWRFLGGDAAPAGLAVYASGINPDKPAALAQAKWDEGYRAFKIKIGFGIETDLRNIQAMRESVGDDVPVMVDANQKWTVDEAIEMSRALGPFNPHWLEEPVPVDTSIEDWRRLQRSTPVPLAGGENLRGAEFDSMIAARVLSFVQPDIAKWGGFTGCLPVARKATEAGLIYCPHFLAGGIGLIASAHLMAVAGGPGSRLEVDANDNPLREGLAQPFPAVRDGRMALPDGPGLGVEPDLDAVREWVQR